jgi:hypothetical protein
MSLPYLTSSNIGFGSVIITPTTGNANGVSFIAEESDPVMPTAQTTRTTELGAPNGWLGFAERKTWRGKLQLATNITAHPYPGDEFVIAQITNSNTSVNINFVFTEISEPKRPRDFWTIDAQALEKA